MILLDWPLMFGTRLIRQALGLVCMTLVAACQPAPPAKKSLVVTAPQIARTPDVVQYPAEFSTWLAVNPDQASQFEALKAYLIKEGVGDVLPLWQLIQTETPEAAAKCAIAGFAVPPKDMWPIMVPTLRLVRQEIVPLVGPVKVLSSFRTPQANKCASGAPESPHKRYSALDLAILSDMSQKEMFGKLCKHWDRLSPRWGYGLGAYYTRYQPWLNKEGRFHVDTMGRRTWGFGYGAYTSHCRELGYITVKSPEEIKREEEAKLKAEADAAAQLLVDAKAKADADAKAQLEASAKARAKLDAVALETQRLKRLAEQKARNAAVVPILPEPVVIIAPETKALNNTRENDSELKPKPLP